MKTQCQGFDAAPRYTGRAILRHLADIILMMVHGEALS